ncbi:hypothetical protein GF362_00070 [Candidatus Dojkabacteria bacterium]|nr:hypothetical protein [Candidatus Dojkabacteria bacterium]
MSNKKNKEIKENDVLDIINSVGSISHDPKKALEKLLDLMNKYKEKGLTNKEKEKMTDLIRKHYRIYELDTHCLLSSSVDEIYKELSIKFARDITEEYNCRSPSEKALVQMVTSAYIRFLEYTNRSQFFKDIEYLSNEKISYYSKLCKETDRAYKQYLKSLSMLKRIKSPPLKVNVKTENAYIAEKQLLQNNPNFNSKDNDSKNT